MRALVCIILVLFGFKVGCFSQLSPQVAREITERLDALQRTTEQNAQRTFQEALRQIRAASASPSTAVTFYTECVRQVNFEESERSQSEFREWRKNNEQRLRDPALRRVLQLQLLWLEMTLRATMSEVDRTQLAREAQRYQNDLHSEAENLSQYRDLLNRSVLETEFARALRVHTIRPQNWPANPLDVAAVYNQIILPPLRTARDLRAMRDAWAARLRHQETLVSVWTDPRRRNLQKFLIEDRPQLVWDMHKDLFVAGDANASARAMLAHIQENIPHPRSINWVQELRQLATQSLQSTSLGQDQSTDAE